MAIGNQPVGPAIRSPALRLNAIGATLGLAGFLPVLVIVSLAPAVPAMIAHFSTVPHASVVVPLMVTIPGLVVALLGPFAGVLVDRVGRRLPLLLATGLYAFVGMAPMVLTGLLAIAASRLLVGICETFIVICVNALLADYFEPARRRFWLAAQGVAFPFLVAAVAALSGQLTAWRWNGAFLSYGLVLPVFLCIVLFCKEPERATVNPSTAAAGKFPVRESIVIAAVTIFSCAMFYVYVVQVGLAYAAVGVGSSVSIGHLIGLASLTAPLGALLFVFLSRRLNAEYTLAACLSLLGLGMIIIGAAHSATVVLIGSGVQQVSAGMLITSLIYWVASVYAPQHRGRAFGFWSSASFLSQFLSPLLVGGTLGLTGGILPTFLALGVVTVGGAGAMLVAGRRPLRNVA